MFYDPLNHDLRRWCTAFRIEASPRGVKVTVIKAGRGKDAVPHSLIFKA
jgi:hypothetical protein